MAKTDYPTNEIENADDSIKDGHKIIAVVEKDIKTGVETTTYDILRGHSRQTLSMVASLELSL